MKILFLADVESPLLWDYFKKEYLADIDLIISCGDLKASYLSFLATMSSVPVLYVNGNHDDSYTRNAPDGCDCIDGLVYEFNGYRILGLGGSNRYKPGINQYTEKEMEKRVKKLERKTKKGIDILVTHAPARGFHDDEDQCHMGFEVFHSIIDTYKPKIFAHGHVHMNYGRQFTREDQIGDTKVINAYEKYIIEI